MSTTNSDKEHVASRIDSNHGNDADGSNEFDERLRLLGAELSTLTDEIHNLLLSVHSNVMSALETYNPGYALDGEKKEDSIDLRNNPSKLLKILMYDLNELQNIAKSNDALLSAKQKEINECDDLLVILSSITSASESILKCDEMITNNCNNLDLTTIYNRVKTMEETIANLAGNSGKSSCSGSKANKEVLSILKRECKIIKTKFIAKLQRLLKFAIEINAGKVTVKKIIIGVLPFTDVLVDPLNPILLHDVWSILINLYDDQSSAASISLLEQSVKDIVQQLFSKIIVFFWKEKKFQPAIRVATEDKSEITFENISKIFIHKNDSSTDGLKNDSQIAHLKSGEIENDNDITNYNALKKNQALNQKNKRNTYTEILKHSNLSFEYLLENIISVLKFMSLEIFLSKRECLSLVSRELSSSSYSFMNVLRENMVNLMPSEYCDISSYSVQIGKKCAEFEDFMIMYGLGDVLTLPSISPPGENDGGTTLTDDGTRPLTVMLANLNNYYCGNWRQQLLATARDLLIADYHNCMVATGDARDDDPASAGQIGDRDVFYENPNMSFFNEKLRFETCQVSLATNRILKLIYKSIAQITTTTLTDSTEGLCADSRASLNNTMYLAARDSLELFLAIVPVKYSQTINSNIRMGCVFFNDCLYIAHNCTIFTFYIKNKSKSRDDKSIGTFAKAASFVDFIPRFRSLGEQVLNAHIDQQRSLLFDLLDKVNITPCSNTLLTIIGSATTDSTLCNSKNDLQNATLVVKHFENLSSQLIAVLQESAYERVMGHLLECVIRAAMVPILNATLISEDDCRNVVNIYKTLQATKTIFPILSKVENKLNGSTNSGGMYNGGLIDVHNINTFDATFSLDRDSSNDVPTYENDQIIISLIACWSKFVTLVDILQYSISEMIELLPRKRFQLFTPQEMAGLVKALFQNSPKRQNLLQAISEVVM